ncbi:hypothetical protein FQN51_004919 [Onygenales sp. PD_10]|nr:hypothetical protein FQN51_004919 [Onygenales sp. PD_10]
MPPLSSASLSNILVDRNSVPATASDPALLVICAWPVSGQYGPGTRVLYYALIAACIFARKAEWLRNACLAAVLLFPAVAALHGIVLAVLNLRGGVDLDIYGAFQLCSIGILTAPVTVRVSRTYFYDPGRNIIFLWTGLILAGLLSLTVEFFRIQPSECTQDDAGNPLPKGARNFPYGNATCNLVCQDNNPKSPMRGGSASNIYVIPAPDRLTFGTATLLAAACCIPAILSLISMWNKILEINWKNRFGDGSDDGDVAREDEPIEGTNGATIGKMNGVNALVRLLLSAVEIPILGAAVIAILIIGELNFWSSQVLYETEPVASIGQWAPIVGAGLAILGSLYLVLAADMDAVEKSERSNNSVNHDDSSMHEIHERRSMTSIHSFASGAAEGPPSRGATSCELVPTTTRSTAGFTDTGGRRKIAKALTTIGNYLSNAAHDRVDDSEFKTGPALDFPEIPGEIRRNPELTRIRGQYNQDRGDATPTPTLRGRSGSFRSVASSIDLEGLSRVPSRGSSRSPSPIPRSRPHALTLESGRTSSDSHPHPPSSPLTSTPNARPKRRDTLEVPTAAHHSRNHSSSSSIPSIHSIPNSPGAPTIIVSSDQETSSPVRRTVTNPPSPISHSESIRTPPAAASPTSPQRSRQFTLP